MNNLYEYKGISPFAIVHPNARIGKNCYIGPFSVIGANVVIGDNNYIGPQCLIGEPPEHKEYFEGFTGRVVIGSGNKFYKQNTIDGGTEGTTYIGDDNLFLKGAHVGHDSQIKNRVILACDCIIGGHCIIESDSRVDLNSVVNPRIQIPPETRIGAMSFLTKKTKTETRKIYGGSPAKLLKVWEK